LISMELPLESPAYSRGIFFLALLLLCSYDKWLHCYKRDQML
jgi:hypothetical protein